MSTKCRHCGSTSYGSGCYHSPTKKHEHRDDEKTVLVQKSEVEDVLGIVSPSFVNIMDRIRDNCHGIMARIELPCSHQGKQSACVVAVSKK